MIGYYGGIPISLMRYSLHEIDSHDVVASTVAADRDEALEWFSQKLRLMLSFEGDPASADYLLDEWDGDPALHATCAKADHSGFRSQSDDRASSGIARRWMRV
jgi:hypothetical protein